ncbi:MAG: hypothetical protein PHF06_09630 [Sphaerochaeta sp.]|jgi:hypothetical protein|uniref:DUF6657 family protein n=1 Tax=Sphaerochaeta TaxID=399320 RepID=UPI00258DFE31|nr:MULTISPECIES: DUF6657 family protein [Sphaerochaeta]MDT3359590.1 hypothetical protein [Spirochaetota bacterium]MDD3424766.1 hypothetical protein [Sphaerochaeta sp.]MDD4038636.1 hypothetical protein [Sphaerochaeta sp.]MDD4450403.1 hypothetical protein [Sphaerochaeta sp.]MDX9983332.1 hypothetical protein [Sphaerochaeta sp.]
MAIIKSAWELALEKTEKLQVDPVKIKRDLKVKEGRQLAGTFLSDIDATKEGTKKQYDAVPAEEKEAFKEGMALTMLSNLALPRNTAFKENFAKVLDLGMILGEGNEQLEQLLGQLEGFFSQYLENQEDLVERMKQQFAPALQQKEAQLRKQYGPNFTLRPEQDPEFMKLLDKQLSQLDDQYTNILTQAKAQIKDLLGIQ